MVTLSWAQRYVSARLGRSPAEGTLIIDLLMYLNLPPKNASPLSKKKKKRTHVGVKTTFSLAYHSLEMLNPMQGNQIMERYLIISRGALSDTIMQD